jgi:hypothetical protein
MNAVNKLNEERVSGEDVAGDFEKHRLGLHLPGGAGEQTEPAGFRDAPQQTAWRCPWRFVSMMTRATMKRSNNIPATTSKTCCRFFPGVEKSPSL